MKKCGAIFLRSGSTILSNFLNAAWFPALALFTILTILKSSVAIKTPEGTIH
jgi:hypothetical protein